MLGGLNVECILIFCLIQREPACISRFYLSPIRCNQMHGQKPNSLVKDLHPVFVTSPLTMETTIGYPTRNAQQLFQTQRDGGNIYRLTWPPYQNLSKTNWRGQNQLLPNLDIRKLEHVTLLELETYWEFASDNPPDAVAKLQPSLFSVIAGGRCARFRPNLRLQANNNALSLSADVSPGEQLRVYAKNNTRVRIEVVFTFKKKRL